MTTPEQLHLALNHLPFLGAGFALIPLIIGILSNNRVCMIAGLLIAAVSGWATPIVMSTGEEAYERYEHGPILPYLDPDFEESLEHHEHFAHTWSKAMYANAVVSTLGLVLLLWKAKWNRRLSLVASVFCLVSLVSGILVAESGGDIRRPDFRSDSEQGTQSEASSEQISH